MNSFAFSLEEIEQMAAETHAIYIEQGRVEGSPSEYLANYSDLSEVNKESNRSFVRNIPKAAERMGYSIIPLRSKTKIKQLLPNEIEFLAKMEHVRWMAEKQGKGWR